jgi:hypothetical protein
MLRSSASWVRVCVLVLLQATLHCYLTNLGLDHVWALGLLSFPTVGLKSEFSTRVPRWASTPLSLSLFISRRFE